VEWNPPGPDLDREYVMIENRGPGSQDMTGWTLSDDSDHVYAFPDGFVLAGTASVRVWTKSGRDTSIDLYWGRSSGVWGSDDTAFLLDDIGTVIDRYEW
jgi:micrococcal nuclease